MCMRWGNKASGKDDDVITRRQIGERSQHHMTQGRQ